MTEVRESEWKKRNELYKGITQLGISDQEAKKIFDHLEDECIIEITPPEMEEPSLQMVSIQSTHTGRVSGKSYKPGNIIINMKDAAVDALVLGSSTAASIGALSMSQPAVMVFTVLAAVLSAADMGKIRLDDHAALILAALWENRRYGQPADVQEGFRLANQYLESYSRGKLSETEYNDLLDDLKHAGCIDLAGGKIKLIEKIYISYT